MEIQKEQCYSVYIHTNKINEKMYCGITSMKPKRRWGRGSGYKNNPYFYNAINKYGWDNFEHDVIYDGILKESAEQLEIFIINKLNLTNKNVGYNLREGGGTSGHLTEQTKEKLRQSHLGKKASLTTKHKLSKLRSGENNIRAIITEKKVLEIRKLKASCTISLSEAFELYKNLGLTFGAFSNIWTFVNWKDVGQEYNTLEVLEWHKSHGKAKGENASSAKLTNEEVEELKKQFICGANVEFLANEFDLTKGNIYKIFRGELYSDIRSDLNIKIKYIQKNKFILRDVIYKLFLYGISYSEIEQILNISNKQVINAIYDKNKQLKILKEGGIMKDLIRGGHNYQATGSSALLNEVVEDRLVKDSAIKWLRIAGDIVIDGTPPNCDRNTDLAYGINLAKSNNVDLGISIHFNKAYDSFVGKIGSEVWLNPNNSKTSQIGTRILNNLSAIGFKNRGLKDGINGEHLYEVRNFTNWIIVEVCFVEATEDVALYKSVGYDKIGKAIAEAIVGHAISDTTKKGWIQENNIWHYYNENGMVKSGWGQDSSKRWFYLDSNGSMISNGWALYKSNWYYFGGDGEMFVSKWAYWNDDAYYLSSDGAMLVNTKTPDGYIVGLDGAWDGQPAIK